MTVDRYACRECGHICKEDDMGSDYYYLYDEDGNIEDDVWSNWICPKCLYWPCNLDEWTLLRGGGKK